MFSIPKIILFAHILKSTYGYFTTIPEGYVGIYSIMGQIQDRYITSSRFYLPFYSSIKLVKYIQDTDHVYDTKCVSKEGVDINIPDIEIANKIDKKNIVNMVKLYGFDYDTKLVVKPLAQYMRELCANRTVDQIEIHDFYMLDDLLKTEIQRQVDSIQSNITIDYVRVTSVIVPREIKEKTAEIGGRKGK